MIGSEIFRLKHLIRLERYSPIFQRLVRLSSLCAAKASGRVAAPHVLHKTLTLE
jgi:hypothetical protein